MKKHFNLRNVTFLIYFSLLIGIAYTAYSRSTGIIGVTKKSSFPGCTCHNMSPSSDVTVQWSGPDTVIAGESADYSIMIMGGPLVRGGTNIAVKSGALATIDNSLRIEDGELTHVAPKAPSAGAVTFSFRYTAPAVPGVDTIYSNGNSVNFTGGFDGDSWNFASNRAVTIITPTGVASVSGVPVEFALSQNFPNPFNPETNITFSITEKSKTSLEITDITGRVVQNIVNEVLAPGIYSVKWNASAYPSGVYFYSLVSGGKREVKKLTLIK